MTHDYDGSQVLFRQAKHEHWPHDGTRRKPSSNKTAPEGSNVNSA